MSDVVDVASNIEQNYLEECMRLHETRAASYTRPKPIGICYECEESVEGERLFCDGECATSWERNKNR